MHCQDPGFIDGREREGGRKEGFCDAYNSMHLELYNVSAL